MLQNSQWKPPWLSYSYSGLNTAAEKIHAIPQLAVHSQDILTDNSKVLNVTTLIQPDVNSSLCKSFCYLIPKNSTSRMSILLHYWGKSSQTFTVFLPDTHRCIPRSRQWTYCPFLETTLAFNPQLDYELLGSKRTHLSFLNYFCTHLHKNQISLKSVELPLHLLNQIKDGISKLW